MHASGSNITTAELASILEGKYGLISKFTDKVMSKLVKRLERVTDRVIKEKNTSIFSRDCEGWLQNEWRNFINNEEHNIKTKTSSESKRSFVETGDYFKSLRVKITLKKN